MKACRELSDLRSVGAATLRDFELLGICSVTQVARRDPEELYKQLHARTSQRQDVCCLDVLRAAVAQARNPNLPAEKCNWWYWSRLRRAGLV